MELLWSHVFSNWISSGLGGSILSLELPQFLQWTCRTSHCPYLSWCFQTSYGPCWAFSTWWKVKVKVAQSYPTLCDPMDYTVHGLSLLQGIYPTQGSNPGLWHCRWILYQMSHKGSPTILEWVAYSFSSGSSRHRNWTRVSCIADGISTKLSYWGSPHAT